MSKDRGFIDFKRKDAGYRPVEERVRDFHAAELRPADELLHEQSARCMDCGTPFCHVGCPLGNVIPEFNDHAYNNRWKEALEVLLETNSFPEFTGKICPAPCEASCCVGINGDAVTIRQLESAIIEKGFERGLMEPKPPLVRMAESVAVVGSGPAGLAAAAVLNKAGYRVVVYEDAAAPGGILRYGIPDFKLEKWIVDRRVKLMRDEGIVFELGVEIGKDLSHRYLKDRFDAVVLTGGAREPRDLPVPGRALGGIHFAMRFLVQQNRRGGGEPVRPGTEILAAGKHVVVIGGGDTGADCVGTSIRQGAQSVRQYELLPRPPAQRSPRTPWPQWPDMLRESSSHKEGCERRWCVTTNEFVGEGGHVKKLRCAEVEWTPGPEGRPAPKEKPGSEFFVEADLVLLAMGFVGPGKNLLVEKLGIALDKRGFIQRDAGGMTSDPGTFVAGDMTQGASLVVRAIDDGQKTARRVIEYLRRPRG
jgi:glutamate synthase (NADPH/NADH) small chain